MGDVYNWIIGRLPVLGGRGIWEIFNFPLNFIVTETALNKNLKKKTYPLV